MRRCTYCPSPKDPMNDDKDKRDGKSADEEEEEDDDHRLETRLIAREAKAHEEGMDDKRDGKGADGERDGKGADDKRDGKGADDEHDDSSGCDDDPAGIKDLMLELEHASPVEPAA
jgi:hypothetical protein